MPYFGKNPVSASRTNLDKSPPAKSKSEVKIMKTIKDLDIVALTEDLEATHFETKQIIKLSFMTSRNSCDGI